ncbi:MAG: SAM-dependent methyltransferase [Candidatus Lokiarchaeota archaeon]|nr:SAM-dependent methyltransferase [Candidatus Harpocratesius repetitus]
MVLHSPDKLINQHWIKNNLGLKGEWGQKLYRLFFTNIQNQISVKIEKSSFNLWKNELCNLYPMKELTIELYAKHCLLFSILFTFLEHALNNMNKSKDPKAEIPHYFDYFDYFEWIVKNHQIIKELADLKDILTRYQVESEDLFAGIYQELIFNSTRHIQGEFYTDEVLCEQMVESSYKMGMKVLDPTCGSGTFLLIIARKILKSSVSFEEKVHFLSSLYGIDQNPLAYLMTRVNLMLLASSYGIYQDIFNIFHKDSLEIHPKDLNKPYSTISQRSSNVPIKQPKKEQNLFDLWDLIIGNPPWLVLNGIPSKEKQLQIKKLGNDLNILLGGRFATSTEITTIFWQKMVNEFLKPGGIIHFVVPASLATGSQHARFRQFLGVEKIEIWDFTVDFFRIHNICLKAQKSLHPLNKLIKKTHWIKFSFDEEHNCLKKISEEDYLPIMIEFKNKSNKSNKSLHDTKDNSSYRTLQKWTKKKLNSGLSSISNVNNQGFHSSILVGRLISEKQLISLFGRPTPLQISENQHSPYKVLFRQGASLVPRNLLFVEINGTQIQPNVETNPHSVFLEKHKHIPYTIYPNKEAENSKIIEISPATSIQSKKDSTWNFNAYTSVRIESKYLFPVAKSTGLLSFCYFQPYMAALPIEISSNSKAHIFSQVRIPDQPLARKHFTHLSKIYTQNLKSGAKITDLFSRLDYGHALSDPKQLQQPKIVFAGIGSNVKAAILHKPAIIDTSLYFYIPSSIDEAYYLIGILNSDFIISFVRLSGSTGANGSLRNIHKAPFKLPIPIYNSNNDIHRQISEKARNIEKSVYYFLDDTLKAAPELKNKIKTLQIRLINNPHYRQQIMDLTHFVQKVLNLP